MWSFGRVVNHTDDYECIAEGTIAEYVIDPTRRVNTETFIDLCTGPSTVCGILSNGTSLSKPSSSTFSIIKPCLAWLCVVL
jgi:hypothetical protein